MGGTASLTVIGVVSGDHSSSCEVRRMAVELADGGSAQRSGHDTVLYKIDVDIGI